MNINLLRILEQNEIKRQKIKNLVLQLLEFLIDFEQVNRSQIKNWDVLYWNNLQEERGLKAGTFPLDDEKYVICLQSDITENEINHVVSHEIIHLIQYFKGDAVRPQSGGFVWKGESQVICPPNDPNYFEQPWEKEAEKWGAILEFKLKNH